MRVDVKAVTLHRFRVEQTEQGWEALVILEIKGTERAEIRGG